MRWIGTESIVLHDRILGVLARKGSTFYVWVFHPHRTGDVLASIAALAMSGEDFGWHEAAMVSAKIRQIAGDT